MKLIDRDHTRNSKPVATHYRLPQKARSVMTQYAPFAGMSGFGSNFTCVHLLQARRQKLCVLLLSLSLSLAHHQPLRPPSTQARERESEAPVLRLQHGACVSDQCTNCACVCVCVCSVARDKAGVES